MKPGLSLRAARLTNIRSLQDVVVTRRAVAHYESMDNTFVGTREHKFLSAITDAIENGDMEQL